MEFLKRAVLTGMGILCLATGVNASDRPLVDFSYAGYLQARFTGHVYQTDHLDGLLSTGLEPNRASGEKDTQANFHTLSFSMKTPFFFPRCRLKVNATVNARHAVVDEAYLFYQANKVASYQAGLFRIPFGLEPQTSSGKMDTIERALAYGFGNFGWVDTMGLQLISEKSLGARADYRWHQVFAGLTPSVHMAVISGNGKNTKLSTPTQGLLRLAVANHLRLDEIRNDMVFGVSGALGPNRFDLKSYEYMPIGIRGNLASHPEAALTTASFDRTEMVTTLGADSYLRTNDFFIKAEWVTRRTRLGLAEAYYGTFGYALNEILPGLEAIVRWEEAKQSYADGAHIPDLKYGAATAGLNWKVVSAWKLQLNYIALYLNRVPHQFPGSDLVLLQLQINF